eukprot:2586355-Rhodomonas_salina.1
MDLANQRSFTLAMMHRHSKALLTVLTLISPMLRVHALREYPPVLVASHTACLSDAGCRLLLLPPSLTPRPPPETQWSPMTPAGIGPSARHSHAGTTFSSAQGMIFIFGG